ncbi:MAG: phosphate signaling complex protein PhoU [Proteobacteria bacterium]|nr:phosphate signaling complex protein PhoU [Pseudomonadota bacterium]MBU1745202.1 phosphate signaling complex protein PhoU [Pseudomonadota bacterium]MBU1965935.1 phosphate signaling complex protein PhoU [Pseudomonadota bacterium]MBU4582487.1 phosphate signaling complex protein PhoU [Pseudomonadota bacterium]MCG2742100.1 phosphate signaling complex protein PhoU [Syntrophaceae bacterium]
MEDKRHTSREYERELQEIRDGLLYLGALTERALERGAQALLERNSVLAREIVREDEQIDRLDVDLEEKCIRLLALRQPAARDLRFITTAIKITGHLERIGDMAANIAEKVLILNDLPQIKPYIDLPRMVEISRGMIRKSLDAMVREDIELAKKVREEEAVIDQLNDQVFRELLTFMMEDPRKIQVCLYIMQISKSLERIADHAEGVADMVIYMVTGTSVRHKPASAENG